MDIESLDLIHLTPREQEKLQLVLEKEKALMLKDRVRLGTLRQKVAAARSKQASLVKQNVCSCCSVRLGWIRKTKGVKCSFCGYKSCQKCHYRKDKDEGTLMCTVCEDERILNIEMKKFECGGSAENFYHIPDGEEKSLCTISHMTVKASCVLTQKLDSLSSLKEKVQREEYEIDECIQMEDSENTQMTERDTVKVASNLYVELVAEATKSAYCVDIVSTEEVNMKIQQNSIISTPGAEDTSVTPCDKTCYSETDECVEEEINEGCDKKEGHNVHEMAAEADSQICVRQTLDNLAEELKIRKPQQIPRITSICQADTSRLGEINMAMKYEGGGALTVLLNECKNLSMGDKEACHYYIQSYLLSDCNGTRRLTPICSGTQNPIFNKEIRYDEVEVVSDVLVISIWNWGTFTNNTFIGEVGIPLGSVDWTSEEAVWLKLCDNFSTREEHLEAKSFFPDVKNTNIDCEPDKEQCEILLGCYLYAKETVMVHLNKVRNVEKEFKTVYVKTKVIPDPHLQTKRRSLIKTNMGTQDYNVFRMYGFMEEELDSYFLQVSVWKYKLFGRNKCIGQTTIPFSSIIKSTPYDTWYTLEKQQRAGANQ